MTATSTYMVTSLVATGLFAAGCEGRADSAPVEPVTLRLTTGPPGGSFSPFGEALAQEFEKTSSGFRVRARASGGSIANVLAIQDGEADIGLAFADVAYQAFVGQLDGSEHRFDRLRAIGVLQLTPVHLIARAGASIHSVADLRGRRVAVGPRGSGTGLTARLILQAFGVPLAAVELESLPFSEAAVLLEGGSLDAMFDNAVQRTESAEQALRSGARLVPITGILVDRLGREYPFLRPTVIPRGRYPGTAAIATVGVDNLLLCHRDLSEAVAHEITKRLFERLPSLSLLRDLEFVDFAQAPATPIPLHDGAARYYREQELLR